MLGTPTLRGYQPRGGTERGYRDNPLFLLYFFYYGTPSTPYNGRIQHPKWGKAIFSPKRKGPKEKGVPGATGGTTITWEWP
jgi:hypothetical protein